MTVNHSRIGYLDAAKGVSIICIVIGHSYSYYVGNGRFLIPYLYSFHVPIFFIISGILYAQRQEGNLNIVKKFKELFVPYIFWGTLYQMCLGMLSVIGGENFYKEFFTRISTLLQLTSGAMWFLPTMFIATILFGFSSKTNNTILRWGVCLLAFVLGVVAPHNSVISESLWRGMIGFSFMTVGYYSSNLLTKQVKWPVWFLMLIVDIVLVWLYGTANLAGRKLGFIPLYLVVSLLGSWLCIAACNYLESKHLYMIYTVLKQLGKFSIVVLCTHQTIFTFLQLVDYKVLNYRIQQTGELEGIIMAAIIIIITYLIMPVLIRYLGWSFGFQNNNKK